MEFSNEEYADIIYVYGFCDGNALAACREYERRFPNRRQPSRRVFSNSFQRLRECGISKRQKLGRNIIHTAEQEEMVIDSVLNEPEISTRRISINLGLSQSFVWKTLNREVLHPFHKQAVHNLVAGDAEQRLIFCRWLLEELNRNPRIISEILWSDESIFTRDGINNFHNNHVWSLENPHAVRVRNFQHRLSINIWCGIFEGRLLPLLVLPHRLNANSYLEILENQVEDMLDNTIPLNLRNRMWFQHDGAPPHVGRNVVRWLNNKFNQRWIGRNGPIHWPARSPDLNPLDFYLWGHLKSIVYSEPAATIEQLQNRINNAVQHMQDTTDFEAVYNSLVQRCNMCIRENGGIFEHLL